MVAVQVHKNVDTDKVSYFSCLPLNDSLLNYITFTVFTSKYCVGITALFFMWSPLFKGPKETGQTNNHKLN